LDAAARRWVKTGQVSKPRRLWRDHYAVRLRRYEALLNALNPWSEP
jgi:hypothetical protein